MNGIKGIALVLIAVFVVSGAALFAVSDDADAETYITDDQGVIYSIWSDGTASVYGCDYDIEGDIVIPEKISDEDGNEYPVLEVSDWAFSYCDGITSISMPYVEFIGWLAFTECSSIVELYLPSVEYLGGETICEMDSLKVLDLPSLKGIGYNAIYDLPSLEYINIPSLERIESNLLYACPSLKTIGISDENPYFEIVDGVMYSEDMTILYKITSETAGEFTVPDTVTRIATDAIESNGLITKLNLPSVTVLEEGAIYDLAALEHVCMPNVESIGRYVFRNAPNLTTLDIGDDNDNFTESDNVIYNKDMTELVVFPSGLTGEFTVPDTVTVLDEYTFYHCDGITGLNLPSVVTLKKYSIYHLENLEYVYMPEVESIGTGVLSGSLSLKSIDVGKENKNFTTVGGALYNKDVTKLIKFPRGITGSYTVPDTVETLENLVISDCPNLTELYLPSVKVIDPQSMRYMDSLEYLYIPNLEQFKPRGLLNFPSLVTIDVGDDNDNYVTSDGILYSKDMTSLVRYPEGKRGAFAIPDFVETVVDGAFAYCDITELIVPSSVRTIEDFVFGASTIGVLDMSGATSLEYVGSWSIYCVVSEIVFSTSDWTAPGGFARCSFYDENGDMIKTVSGATVGGMTFVLHEERYIPESCVPADDSMQYIAIGAVIVAIVALLAYAAYRRV